MVFSILLVFSSAQEHDLQFCSYTGHNRLKTIEPLAVKELPSSVDVMQLEKLHWTKATCSHPYVLPWVAEMEGIREDMEEGSCFHLLPLWKLSLTFPLCLQQHC